MAHNHKSATAATCTFAELEKAGVIASASIEKNLMNNVSVTIKPMAAAQYQMTALIADKSLELAVDMNELLDKQAAGLKCIEISNVAQLNIDMLIAFLNKRFVLDNKKQTVITLKK